MSWWWLFPFAALALSWILVWWLARPGNFISAPAPVNDRSLHQKVIPQGGGIAVVLVVCVASPLAAAFGLEGIFGGWRVVGAFLVVAVTSFLDDRYPLPALGRFAIHAAAAGFVLSAGLSLEQVRLPGGGGFVLPSALAWVLSLLGVVWFLNLYNFMDGMDGLAGGMTVLGFSALALLGKAAGHLSFTLSSLIVAAAALGFLRWNFPPAKIFLGDVGSAPLGLLVAAMTLWGVDAGVFSLWPPLLAFSPFWVDASVTLLRRLRRGEKIWEAHREHAYQRLALMGWSHRKTTLLEYGLMSLMAALAVLFPHLSVTAQGWVLALTPILYFGLFRLVDRATRG